MENDSVESEETTEETPEGALDLPPPPPADPRAMGIFQDIDEKKAEEKPADTKPKEEKPEEKKEAPKNRRKK